MSNRSKKDRRLINTSQEVAEQERYQIMAAFRSGPLPPPAEVEKYEALYPGAAKQLFDNFIAQTNHRMELEKTVIAGDDKRASAAQRNSFIICMTAIVIGGVLLFTGKSVEGLASVLGALGTLVVAFFGGSIMRGKERNKKKNGRG